MSGIQYSATFPEAAFDQEGKDGSASTVSAQYS